MDLSTITAPDFKAYFRRDFLYLPIWSEEKTYNAGAVVFYAPNELFYKALENGVESVTPEDAEEWEQISDDVDNYVLDEDIEKAFEEARSIFNTALFGTEDETRMVFLYLTAHYLVMDLRTAQRGIESTGESLVSSRSVGSVSESYAIPEAWTNEPVYNFFTKTGYGLKYLSIVLPRVVGNIGTVAGGTNP